MYQGDCGLSGTAWSLAVYAILHGHGNDQRRKRRCPGNLARGSDDTTTLAPMLRGSDASIEGLIRPWRRFG